MFSANFDGNFNNNSLENYMIHESPSKMKIRDIPRNMAMTHLGLLHFVNLLLDSQFQILHCCRIHHRNIYISTNPMDQSLYVWP